MFLLLVGCSFRSTPVALRERLAFSEAAVTRALTELDARFGCEAVILSTCNRVDVELLAEFLGEFHCLGAEEIRPHLYEHRQMAALDHLFRVVASLDSLIVG